MSAHTSAAPGVIGDDQLAGVGNSQQPVSGEPPRGGQATGDGFHRGSGHASEAEVLLAFARLLYALARLVEVEDAVYQRVLRLGAEHSATYKRVARNAILAAWPHLRAAALQPENEA